MKLFSAGFSSRISIFPPINWPLKSDYSSLSSDLSVPVPKCLSAWSAWLPECLECPSTLPLPFKCPSFALWVKKNCSINGNVLLDGFIEIQLELNVCFLKCCTHFLLNNICRTMSVILFILFRSWVINKDFKNLVSVSV